MAKGVEKWEMYLCRYCACYFFSHLLLCLISGFWIKYAFCSAGWTGCTYVSTAEQLGAWTDIKAIHAWGNLFYNSSRKPAYASARCSSLPAIRELKYNCWLGMLINMNLCPDGFYLVYGLTVRCQCHSAGTWIFQLFLQASLCRKLCLRKPYSGTPFPQLELLVWIWLRGYCWNAATLAHQLWLRSCKGLRYSELFGVW